MHLRAEEFHAAVPALNGALERLGEVREMWVRGAVAAALNGLGHAHLRLGAPKEAMRAYEELLERFGGGDAPELREEVAQALVGKAFLQVKSGDIVSAIASCDRTIERFGESDSPECQVQVSMALFHKVYGLWRLEQRDAALEAANQFVERFGANPEPRTQAGLCAVLFCRGVLKAYLGDSDAALADWNDVVEGFGANDEPEAQSLVVLALQNKVLVETEAGRTWEVLRVCDQLESRLDRLSGDERAEVTWTAGSLRAKALLREETPEAALEAFRVAYEVFVPDSTSMMREIQTLVPNLVAGGLPAAELAEVLVSRRTKAEALRPLVAALRLEAGETVREPVEVVEIAKDIRELIAEKAAARTDEALNGETRDTAFRPK